MNSAGHLEKVYSNVRQKLGRQPGDDMPTQTDIRMITLLEDDHPNNAWRHTNIKTHHMPIFMKLYTHAHPVAQI